MDPRLGFAIGKFVVRYYALIIIFGAIVAAMIASWQAKKNGRDPEVMMDVMPWLLIGGIIGARLWHVFTPGYFDGISTIEYLKNPLRILKIWEGGLGIAGGVIGGSLALFIYTKVKKLNFLEWADYIAPGLLIAQGIGRWGNFLNQELYGKPSNLPWAIKIDPPYRYPGFELIEKYHPLFLYEFILNILAGILLLIIGRKLKEKLFKGDLLLLYLVFYPAIRFGLEFVRLVPSLTKSGININQTVMLVVMILAIIALILRHTVFKAKLQAKAEEEAAFEDVELDLGDNLDETTEEELDAELQELDSLDAESADARFYVNTVSADDLEERILNSAEEIEADDVEALKEDVQETLDETIKAEDEKPQD